RVEDPMLTQSVPPSIIMPSADETPAAKEALPMQTTIDNVHGTAPRRMLVIGLDCAAPELLFDAWRAELPTINRLMSQGSYGKLESTIPAMTVPALFWW